MADEQNVDIWRREVEEQYLEAKRKDPGRFERRLNISWSNWGFGLEELERSAERLAGNGLSFIELHGNHYGPSLGYEVEETRRADGAAGRTPADLIDAVCSPGGTTVAGVVAMERSGFSSAVIDAFEATVARDRELGA